MKTGYCKPLPTGSARRSSSSEPGSGLFDQKVPNENRLEASTQYSGCRMVRDRGFEPLTPSVSRKCSTTELTAPPMPKDRLGTLCFSWSFVEADGQEIRSSQDSFQAEKRPRCTGSATTGDRLGGVRPSSGNATSF